MKTIPERQGFPGGIQKDGKVMGMYEAWYSHCHRDWQENRGVPRDVTTTPSAVLLFKNRRPGAGEMP